MFFFAKHQPVEHDNYFEGWIENLLKVFSVRALHIKPYASLTQCQVGIIVLYLLQANIASGFYQWGLLRLVIVA